MLAGFKFGKLEFGKDETLHDPPSPPGPAPSLDAQDLAIDLAWAEAEAWVEGLIQAEERAWAELAR